MKSRMARRKTLVVGSIALLALGSLALVVVACAENTPQPLASVTSTQTPPKPAPVSVKPEPSKLPVIDGYEVVNTYPHDASSYTQGLVYDGGRLIESQGQYGQSSMRVVELETGKVLKKQPLDGRYFGEGCTVLKGLAYQLTWQQKTVFVYEARELKPLGSFPLEGEGWGLTTDGASLFVTDGTDTVRVVDPTTHAVTRKVPVRVAGRALFQLNELEWVEGELWANVWHTDRIARIDPKTGEVTRFIDLTGLLPANQRRDAESVLNGIAYDPQAKRIFVTGKNWPKLFEIRVKPRS